MTYEYAECRECGQGMLTQSRRILGFMQAVHLAEQHPETYEPLKEEVQNLMDAGEDMLDQLPEEFQEELEDIPADNLLEEDDEV